MVTGVQVYQKILYGYAKAAEFVGTPFLHYRASTPINPIVSGNLLGTLLANTNTTWEYMKASSYGNRVYNIIIDARYSSGSLAAKVGDYLVGTTSTDGLPTDLSTYFIQSLQIDLPPQAIQCNRTINIIRPAQATGVGNVGYVGYTQTSSTIIMTAMPASVVIQGSESNAKTKLPTDTKNPAWLVFLPNIGDVQIKIGDIIIDNFNQNYVIKNNELTELGWRLRAEQVVNNG